MSLRTARVGDPVTELRRRGDFLTWSRYAAVNYEFAGHHMDDEVAHHEGFPAAFAMAPLTFAYVQTMLRDWVGEEGRLVTTAIRLRSPFLRGRTLVAGGTVTEVRREGDEVVIAVDLWADDDTGTRLVEGTGSVAVPVEGHEL